MSIRTASLRLPRQVPSTLQPTRRTFFSLPGDTQTLTATRTLPYARSALYDLISDVDSYHTFVPYCSKSHVTQWSTPDSSGRRYPTLADLHVGWGGFNEAFTSRLRCVPGTSVEAVSGDASQDASAVFKTLVTKWSLQTRSDASTQVDLNIRYQFANPLYAAVSAAVSDKIAGLMIEAFEKQALQRLGGKQNGL